MCVKERKRNNLPLTGGKDREGNNERYTYTYTPAYVRTSVCSVYSQVNLASCFCWSVSLGEIVRCDHHRLASPPSYLSLHEKWMDLGILEKRPGNREIMFSCERLSFFL